MSDTPTIRPSVSNPLGSNDSALKIARLEKIIGYLLMKNLTGEPVAASDKLLCEFLGLKEQDATHEAVLRRIGASDVLGTMSCPVCGSSVRDFSGVVEERCQTCGEIVPSER